MVFPEFSRYEPDGSTGGVATPANELRWQLHDSLLQTLHPTHVDHEKTTSVDVHFDYLGPDLSGSILAYCGKTVEYYPSGEIYKHVASLMLRRTVQVASRQEQLVIQPGDFLTLSGAEQEWADTVVEGAIMGLKSKEDEHAGWLETMYDTVKAKNAGRLDERVDMLLSEAPQPLRTSHGYSLKGPVEYNNGLQINGAIWHTYATEGVESQECLVTKLRLSSAKRRMSNAKRQPVAYGEERTIDDDGVYKTTGYLEMGRGRRIATNRGMRQLIAMIDTAHATGVRIPVE